MTRLVTTFVVWWLVLLGLELVFISTIETAELVLGAGAATLGAAAAVLLTRLERPSTGPLGRIVPAVLAWPGTLLGDTVHLLRLAGQSATRRRRPRGSFRRVRLQDGAGAAWAGLLISATPGACVVAVDEDAGSTWLTVHRIFSEPSAVERALTDAGTDTREGR